MQRTVGLPKTANMPSETVVLIKALCSMANTEHDIALCCVNNRSQYEGQSLQDEINSLVLDKNPDQPRPSDTIKLPEIGCLHESEGKEECAIRHRKEPKSCVSNKY